jgi:hypothetical protein
VSVNVMVGYFDREETILRAAHAARGVGMAVHDAYTPYAVHGMDEALGLRPSRLTWACFGGGLFGLISGMALMLYTSVWGWPLNVGGKPFASIPAYIPVAFELTVLCGGLTVVAALLFRTRLFPGKSVVALSRVTDDRFALAVLAQSDRWDVKDTQRFLVEQGALETRLEEVAR